MKMNVAKDYADIIPIESWNNGLDHAVFTPDDGVGYFGWMPPTGWEVAGAKALESEIDCFAWRINGKGNEPFNCVVWYNK